jgi:hypothetical protein
MKLIKWGAIVIALRMTRSTVAAAMVLLVVAASAPPTASASTRCDTGRSAVTYTRGGYAVVLKNYRSVRGMACSSVRYVINQWLRRKLARQRGWPRLGRPFFDGWVTWYGYKRTARRWRFEEFESNTAFAFTGYVR